MGARSSLEDFVIDSRLGTGSFGTVYKATRKHDGCQYALKEIDLRGMSEQQQQDCIQECSLLASLDSPYVIKFYDCFLQKGKLYICMEYASGGNLYDYIRRQSDNLPEEQVWQLFTQMLLGLNYMHGRKVLHRDFKTLNVFLDDKLNVRLGDLGVAKVLSDETLNARTMIGTPYYLSPEMCEDRPYDHKSDVWALGVGLYECLARKHPFDAENQGSLILKILRGKYPPVTGYSKELTDIVKSCLTLDASKRPGTTSLLALKSVRERAKQLGIELPPLPPKPAAPSPPLTARPSRPPIAASKSFQSQRTREADPAAPPQPPRTSRPSNGPPRSPTPPISRGPSARVLASVARVDIAGDLLPAAVAGTVAGAPPAGRRRTTTDDAAPAAAGRRRTTTDDAAVAPAGGRRRTTTDDAPGALSGQQGNVEKQLQGLKLGQGGARAKSSPPGHIPAMGVSAAAVAAAAAAAAEAPVESPSSVPDEQGGASASQQAAASKHVDASSLEASSSSNDHTPPSTDRSHRLQQTLPTVKNRLIQLVGPLAYDALHSLVVSAAQAGDSNAMLQQGSDGTGATGVAVQPPLLQALMHTIPSPQAQLVLPLLVKLVYLETQVQEASDCGAEGQEPLPQEAVV